MLIKFYKTIHNKYSTIFKFVFFLRYLIVIFFISLISFLTIPKFFDYEKRSPIIQNYLYKNHFLRIQKYERISFHSLPVPSIEIEAVEIKFDKISSRLFVDKLILYPKLVSIYNYDNFKIKKVILKEGKTELKILESDIFFEKILNQKKPFSIKKINLKLTNKNDFLINLNNINYANFGYDKNVLYGKLINKNFEVKLNDDFSKIDIKIPDIGFQTDLKLEKNNGDTTKGNAKVKIFNTNLKFEFIYTDKRFEIFNSFLRSKYLSFNNNSTIILNPYFDLKSKFIIEDIDLEIFENINFKKFLNSKNIIKKINSKNEIIFIPKKFSNYIFDELDLKINLAYGRLKYQKTLLIDKSIFTCKGSINLFEELPLLDFNCLVSTKDKKEFFKLFSVRNKQENIPFELNIEGNMNILTKKINFKKISSDNYKASKEDLEYFKDRFENILFEGNFLDIFDLKKIKNFILEIS